MNKWDPNRSRAKHIDALRGLAVLAMVQVHTAAMLPAPVDITHILALLSAAIGGMAAPLFVTLSGWAVHRGIRRRMDEGIPIARWLWVRVFALFIFQFAINLLLPQRFKWYTPGVLSLLALCTMIAPYSLMRDRLIHSRLIWLPPVRSRIIRATVVILIPAFIFFLFPSLTPIDDWWWFVEATTLKDWFLRLFINGTYPFFPWVAYFLIGGILDHNVLKESERRPVLRRTGCFAFVALALTGVLAMVNGQPWAMPIGDGILTFFPANPWFVFVSLAWAVFVWDLFRAHSRRFFPFMRVLAPAGRLSLTIYVLHFALLGMMAAFLPKEMSITSAFLITSVHVSLWIIIATFHQKKIPKISIERFIQFCSVRKKYLE